MSHYTDTLEPDDAWTKQALCATDKYADKRDLWFPKRSDERTIRAAKKVCWTCPAIQECLEWAYANREDEGIWGSLTEWERRRVHGRPAPKKSPSKAAA